MGKGSGSAPSAPDPQELTQAQSKANIDAILASQFVNSTPTFTPFGSQQFYVSPTGQYSQVQAPSQPELERLASGYALGNTVLNRSLAGIDQIRPLDFSTAPPAVAGLNYSGMPDRPWSIDMSGAPPAVAGLNYGGMPDRPWSIDMSGAPSAVTSLDFSRAPNAPNSYAFGGLSNVMTADQFAPERRRIEDSIYGRQAEMLRDDFNRRDERLENRLVNQGLRLGSEGYGEARRQLGETENQAYADARTRAIQLGGDEFARAFGMSLQGRQQGANEAIAQSNFGADARQRAIAEATAQASFANQARQSGINESALQAQFGAGARQQAVNELLSNAGLANQARQSGINESALQAQFGAGARQQAVNELLSNAGLANQARQSSINESALQAQFGAGARQQAVNEQQTQASLANQARAAAIQEQLLGRQVPLQELQTYAGFAPGLGMQQFLGTPNYQVAPADVTGATNNQFNAQMNAYNQAQQRQSSNIGALAGVGGAIAGALPWATWLSDRDSKRDVQPVNAEAVLDMVRMMPTSEWSYKPEAQAMGQPGGRHIGPMAQDFRRITGKGDGRSIPVVDAFGMLLTATKALADKVERVA